MTAAPPSASHRIDTVIAAGCWVIAIGLMLLLPRLAASSGSEPVEIAAFGSSAWWLTATTVTVQSVALLWTRTRSRAVVVAVTTAPVLLSLISLSSSPGALYGVTTLAALVAIYVAVLRNSLSRLRITLVVAAVMIATGDVVDAMSVAGTEFTGLLVEGVLQAIAVVGLPTLIGTVVATRRDARIAHVRELSALARERDALVRAAVADERTAMARELHDIAAHHLSGIALMAVVTERQIDYDPDAARDSAQQIRSQARAVLDDLRRLVGLLRDDSSTSRGSVETVAALPMLVQARRDAGSQVHLRILGTDNADSFSAGLGPLAQLVVYRMVQESLANAVRHAPGAQCDIELDGRDPRTATVTVSNTVARTTSDSVSPEDGEPGGFGLVGMKERAHLVGGQLRYGPTDEGGWEVVLSVPCDDEVAESRGRYA